MRTCAIGWEAATGVEHAEEPASCTLSSFGTIDDGASDDILQSSVSLSDLSRSSDAACLYRWLDLEERQSYRLLICL